MGVIQQEAEVLEVVELDQILALDKPQQQEQLIQVVEVVELQHPLLVVIQEALKDGLMLSLIHI